VNVTSDYVPSAPVLFDNCFEDLWNVPFKKLPLHTPLVNVMSSVDDLGIASVKADEIRQMIREQETEYSQNLYKMTTSWWSVLSTASMLIMLILCSCCCCKNCTFWLWDKWNPKDCWQQTKEKCCISIINYSCPEVSYSKHDRPPPAISFRSLSEPENVAINKDQGSTPKEKSECVALIKRNKSSLSWSFFLEEKNSFKGEGVVRNT
jgi:hypothetical protein